MHPANVCTHLALGRRRIASQERGTDHWQESIELTIHQPAEDAGIHKLPAWKPQTIGDNMMMTMTNGEMR